MVQKASAGNKIQKPPLNSYRNGQGVPEKKEAENPYLQPQGLETNQGPHNRRLVSNMAKKAEIDKS